MVPGMSAGRPAVDCVELAPELPAEIRFFFQALCTILAGLILLCIGRGADPAQVGVELLLLRDLLGVSGCHAADALAGIFAVHDLRRLGLDLPQLREIILADGGAELVLIIY